MSELVEFLLARIAEDERVAQEATLAPWVVGSLEVDRYVVATADLYEPGRDGAIIAEIVEALEDGDHIWRWQPTRVLAECEAKRRIVEQEGWGYGHIEQAVLKILVLPYADHPDCREEWKP